MPSWIVVVHDDPTFVDNSTTALRAAGYEAVGFVDPLVALEALKETHNIDLLITAIQFGEVALHGIGLALLVRSKMFDAKILFTALPEHKKHTKGLGEFMPLPVSMTGLLTAVERLIGE